MMRAIQFGFDFAITAPADPPPTAAAGLVPAGSL